MVTLKIERNGTIESFEVSEGQTLLSALYEIKERYDATLTFAAGCRASVCGTCAVRVNEKEVLSCAHMVRDGDTVAPLRYHPLLRDLKVDKSQALKSLKRSEAVLHRYTETALTPEDAEKTERQTDCILCDSCYSACPVLAVEENFLGPFALTRAYRYAIDPREAQSQSIVDAVQHKGVWDCTLCGECTAVCPKGIDPKSDILQLRTLSVQAGYSDPSFATSSFGTPDFSGGFGFDPNGGF